jgi:hypothetical protein
LSQPHQALPLPSPVPSLLPRSDLFMSSIWNCPDAALPGASGWSQLSSDTAFSTTWQSEKLRVSKLGVLPDPCRELRAVFQVRVLLSCNNSPPSGTAGSSLLSLPSLLTLVHESPIIWFHYLKYDQIWPGAFRANNVSLAGFDTKCFNTIARNSVLIPWFIQPCIFKKKDQRV